MKFANELSREQLSAVRDYQINFINDLLKDLAGNKMASDAVSDWEFSKSYVLSKVA